MLGREGKTSLDLPLEDMDLSVRPFCRLHRSGVRTVGDVTLLTEDYLRNSLGLQDRSIQEIKFKLYAYRLTLADNGKEQAIKNPE